NAQQNVFIGSRDFALGIHAVVLVEQFRTLDLLAGDEAGVAGIDDVHAAQHLADDDLDVLVVDLHALQAVDVLHFVDDIARQALDALQPQDVVRVGRAVDDHLALVHHLAVVHQHLFFLGNQELVADAFQVGDDQALLALGVFAERNRTRDIGQHAGVFGRTCFEQLCNTGQTAGNIARLLRFLWKTRQDFTHGDLLPVTNGNERTDREGDVDRVIGTGNLDVFTRLVDQLDLRTHHGLAAASLGRDDHQRRQTGDFVELLRNRNAFFDILEADLTGVFGNDRTGQGIPRGQTLASLDGVTVTHGNRSAIRNLVTFALTAYI